MEKFEEIYKKYKSEVKDYTPKPIVPKVEKPAEESVTTTSLDDVMDKLGEFFAIPAGERKTMKDKLLVVYNHVKGLTGNDKIESVVSYLRSMEEKSGSTDLGVDRLTRTVGRLKTLSNARTILSSGTQDSDSSKRQDTPRDTSKDASRAVGRVPQRITISIEGN